MDAVKLDIDEKQFDLTTGGKTRPMRVRVRWDAAYVELQVGGGKYVLLDGPECDAVAQALLHAREESREVRMKIGARP
jgi:hypothetical protein